MMMKDKDFMVPLSLLNQVAQYLSRQPYADVVSMMQALANGEIVRPIELQGKVEPESIKKEKVDEPAVVEEDGSSN